MPQRLLSRRTASFSILVVTALFVATHAEADADEFTSQVESYYTSDKYTSLLASFYDFPAHLFSFPPDTTPEEDWLSNCLWIYETSMYDMLYPTLYTVLIPPPPSITAMNL